MITVYELPIYYLPCMSSRISFYTHCRPFDQILTASLAFGKKSTVLQSSVRELLLSGWPIFKFVRFETYKQQYYLYVPEQTAKQSFFFFPLRKARVSVILTCETCEPHALVGHVRQGNDCQHFFLCSLQTFRSNIDCIARVCKKINCFAVQCLRALAFIVKLKEHSHG